MQEHVREIQLGLRMATQSFRARPQRVGWLVGSGRSGTTWLSSLLNADNTMREVFEPVHKLHAPLMSRSHEHPYFRAGSTPEDWKKWQSDVFEGKYITRRTDRDNVGKNPAGARKLLVKDVFACGMIAANLDAHPEVAGSDAGERASEGADRGAHRAQDHDVVGHGLSSIHTRELPASSRAEHSAERRVSARGGGGTGYEGRRLRLWVSRAAAR